MKACLIAVIAVASSISLAAQWLNQPTAGIPRTPDGKPNLTAPAPRARDGRPDLSGLWLKISAKYARNVAADLKPDDEEEERHQAVVHPVPQVEREALATQLEGERRMPEPLVRRAPR